MSNIGLLPLYQISTGVQTNEDWRLSLLFTLSENATPLDLTGITFTASISTPRHTVLTSAGTISGDDNNLLMFVIPDDDLVAVKRKTYALKILAQDGTGESRDVLADSTITVGSAQVIDEITLIASGGIPQAVISVIPSGLASVALGELPVEQGDGVVPVERGKAYINQSGFVVVAQ